MKSFFLKPSLLIVFLLVLPVRQVAGDCAIELFFQPTEQKQLETTTRSGTTFKEKIGGWILKKKFKKAAQSSNEEKADDAFWFAVVSVVLFVFAPISLVNCIIVLRRLKKNNGTKKQKRKVVIGLLLSLIATGVALAILISYASWSLGTLFGG